MDNYYLDDLDDLDYDWDFEEEELKEQLRMETNQKKIVNDMNYKAFKSLSDKDKITYLYNKLRDLYSYLLTIQDVVQKGG